MCQLTLNNFTLPFPDVNNLVQQKGLKSVDKKRQQSIFYEAECAQMVLRRLQQIITIRD